MIYAALVIGIFLAELFIKNRVEKKEKEQVNREALGGRILITKYHNTGAFLELGKAKAAAVKWIALALSAAALVIFVITLCQGGRCLFKLGLSLLLGGAFSNTYDRMRRKYVVDYFRFNVNCRPIRRVIFNLSDLCIMVGAALVVLTSR